MLGLPMVQRKVKSDRRRSFLKSSALLGFTPGILGYSNLVNSKDPQVEFVSHYESTIISTDQPPERVPQYKTVSREYWNRMQASENATKNIAKKIRHHWGDTPIMAYTTRNDTSSGYAVDVKYKTVKWPDGRTVEPTPSKEEVREKLPDRAQGEHNGETRNPPVEVNEYEFNKTGECAGAPIMDWTTDWDTIPGGVPINVLKSDGSREPGTCTGAFFNTNPDSKRGDTNGMMTAGHVADDIRHDVYQGGHNSNRYVGDIFDYRDGSARDWAYFRIREQDGFTWTDHMAGQDQSAAPNGENCILRTGGAFTNNGLRNARDNPGEYDLFLQGWQTGRQNANVTAFGYNDLNSTDGWQDVVVNGQVDHGDSGGPLVYDDHDGTVHVGGIIYAHTTNPLTLSHCEGKSACSTAEAVENDIGGQWI